MNSLEELDMRASCYKGRHSSVTCPFDHCPVEPASCAWMCVVCWICGETDGLGNYRLVEMDDLPEIDAL